MKRSKCATTTTRTTTTTTCHRRFLCFAFQFSPGFLLLGLPLFPGHRTRICLFSRTTLEKGWGADCVAGGFAAVRPSVPSYGAHNTNARHCCRGFCTKSTTVSARGRTAGSSGGGSGLCFLFFLVLLCIEQQNQQQQPSFWRRPVDCRGAESRETGGILDGYAVRTEPEREGELLKGRC